MIWCLLFAICKEIPPKDFSLQRLRLALRFWIQNLTTSPSRRSKKSQAKDVSARCVYRHIESHLVVAWESTVKPSSTSSPTSMTWSGEHCQIHEGHLHKLREACRSEKALEVRWQVLNFNSKDLNEQVDVLEQSPTRRRLWKCL